MRVLLLVLLFFCFSSHAKSQTPLIETPKATELAAENKITERHPSKSIDEKAVILWEKTWDDPVAFYTAVLSLFTALLVAVSIVQGYFLLRSDKTARIAANAADLSAKASVGQKLPIIRCATPHLWPCKDKFYDGSFIGTGDPRSDDFIKLIHLNFINHGETHAYPIQYGLGWLTTDRPAVEREVLPPEPEYSDIYDLSGETVIKASAEFETPRIVTFVFAPNESTKRKIASGETTLRLLARLMYTDFLGTKHEARFC